jgi:3-methyladenine DNA glycosylase/8-oxoguanine DNA glycosylase
MAPGPVEAWVAPSAEVVAGLDSPALHPHGVERARADVIIEAARRARRLEEAVTMAPDQAYRRLTAVRGIGPWTAGHVMGRALGDADAVPIGDFHLPNMVAWALAGEPRADDTRMLELLEPYRPHRRRVIVLLKLARITAPAFGPRRAVPDFTRS